MKTLVTLITALALCVVTPALAVPVKVIEFSPEAGTAANWHYSGGILSFDEAVIDKALSADDDTLVGAVVHIPTFEVTGTDGLYTVEPINNEITITNTDGSVTYFVGTLGDGDLGTIGTVAGVYTKFAGDITNIVATEAGQALGSDALTYLAGKLPLALDFELSLQGGSGAGYYSFADMVDGDHTGTGGFSGAMTVPEPATMCLLALGGLSLIRRRRA